MQNYIARTIAALYALGWFVWAATFVGTSTDKAVTWPGAVLFGLTIVAGILCGVAAGIEQRDSKQGR